MTSTSSDTPRWKWTVRLAGVVVGGSLFMAPLFTAAAADESAAAGIEFFEKEVRPLLVQHCYECHGNKDHKGGLRLDSREGWMKGGDSGPAIVPGKPEESLLIEAVRYEGFEMPPKGKLADDQIALLERWVTLGAPDPRVSAAGATIPQVANNIEQGRQHWAYQPPVKVTPPVVDQSAWPYHAIDTFVLAKLEAAGLRTVAGAGRATLARRVYFDLIGLPPTPEQLGAYVGDARPDAYERLVDQLLNSPRFGERWGRHWLDVARFAESVTLRGFVFPEAWRYRDYVIDAFNRDLPYDQFVREQIAGDLLSASSWQEQQRQMIATTFLMLGNINFEEQDKKQLDMDFVDEQLDTIGKAILAQTIGCARCHDHKFDPIPTRDYYALAGILHSATAMEHANVSKWVERPLPVSPAQEKTLREHEQAVAALQAEIKDAKRRAAKLVASSTSGSDGPAIVAVSDLPGIVVDSQRAKPVGQWQHSQFTKRYIGDGYLHDLNEGKGTKTLTFHPELPAPGRYEVRLAYVPSSNRATHVPITILHADGETVVEVNQQQAPPIQGRFVSLGEFRFEQGNQGYVLVSNEGTQGHVIADAVQFLSVEMLQTVAESAKGNDRFRPTADKKADASQRLASEIKRMERRLKQLGDHAPERPMVMTVREDGQFHDVRVHIRGSVHNLGERAPRGLLQVASYGTPPEIPNDESGRRQLAQWLASPANPLTARVMSNRVWHWLFGAGLVRTTDNFGTTGERPSHPELLDHLATRFVDEQWSVKNLVRDMVLSRTYRLSTTADAGSLAADPENRLLRRMNRRRLDAEAIRDMILLVSGQLRSEMGGPRFGRELSADYGYQHVALCRSVYVPVFRNALPDIFEAFDFPDPSMVTGRRTTSTVAPQALFLMNHPFVMEQAEQAARCLVSEPLASDAARGERVYRLALGRLPSDTERNVALQYLGGQNVGENSESERVGAWAQIFQAVFATPEFRYVE